MSGCFGKTAYARFIGAEPHPVVFVFEQTCDGIADNAVGILICLFIMIPHSALRFIILKTPLFEVAIQRC